MRAKAAVENPGHGSGLAWHRRAWLRLEREGWNANGFGRVVIGARFHRRREDEGCVMVAAMIEKAPGGECQEKARASAIDVCRLVPASDDR